MLWFSDEQAMKDNGNENGIHVLHTIWECEQIKNTGTKGKDEKWICLF